VSEVEKIENLEKKTHIPSRADAKTQNDWKKTWPSWTVIGLISFILGFVNYLWELE
jgi:hypothetical protein